MRITWRGTRGVFSGLPIFENDEMSSQNGCEGPIDCQTRKGPESVSRGYDVRTLGAVALGNLRPPLTPK